MDAHAMRTRPCMEDPGTPLMLFHRCTAKPVLYRICLTVPLSLLMCTAGLGRQDPASFDVVGVRVWAPREHNHPRRGYDGRPSYPPTPLSPDQVDRGYDGRPGRIIPCPLLDP